jgi:phosphoglycerate dehydrogenase-like enzyme/glyoxylase-like metal-dependent hydrolase (beta-lactamase superfamily II)
MRAAILLSVLFTATACSAELPKMKFGEVKEIAPGVFFRYSPISPTDPSVFGGSNHVWVVFEEYVVVIDANFPREAGDVLEAIRKTTKKPIRYVLDTHHHGDHAWGNAVWVKAGATILAHRNAARLLRLTGPADFAAAGKGPMGRKDVRESTLKMPSLIFDDRLVLDDGTQRVEFLHFGHSHTIGDAVAWLPRHKILCTGDACVNGAYNYMGQSDSASWIRCLGKMQELDVKLVAPGHGPLADKELLTKQKCYFQELRRQVKKGIDEGKEVEDIIKNVSMPWYKEWTTVNPATDNIKHVWNEYMGLVAPWDFEYDLGVLAGPSPTKDTPGWTKPKRIVVPSGTLPGRLAQLKRAAPEVEFLPARTADEATRLAAEADAVVGFVTPAIVEAGKSLRWLHAGRDDFGTDLSRALSSRKITLTDGRRVDGPHVADQTFALLLALTRNLLGKSKTPTVELHHKTMLLVGLGGTGEQIARRASAFGMKVIALDDNTTDKPGFVTGLGKLSALTDRLPDADVVVLALPLTDKSRGLLGEKQINKMKKDAFLINAAHASLIDLDALVTIAPAKGLGVGLDTAGADSATVRKLPRVVLAERPSTPAPEADERRWRLLRENVRRFAVGEPLLGVVER